MLQYSNNPLYVILAFVKFVNTPNFSSANVNTSDVTSLTYVTYVVIKGPEINILTIKDKRSLKTILNTIKDEKYICNKILTPKGILKVYTSSFWKPINDDGRSMTIRHHHHHHHHHHLYFISIRINSKRQVQIKTKVIKTNRAVTYNII